MKEMISISKKELIEFSKDIYEQGCGGYLDLNDSICTSKVDRLFERTNKSEDKTQEYYCYKPDNNIDSDHLTTVFDNSPYNSEFLYKQKYFPETSYYSEHEEEYEEEEEEKDDMENEGNEGHVILE